jgi:RHH-type rel operon transcriptional repressor/antitoxin RelB
MPTSIRLDHDLDTRLTNLASRTGRSKAFYIREAIASELNRIEYEYGILRDLEDYRAGRLKTYSLDEAGEILELES